MKKQGQLKVGAARADITPDMGIQLAGDIGRYRPTEEIRDRLYVNVMVVESGTERFCWISADLLASTTDWADRIRRVLADRHDLDPARILFHVVQNHASPSLGHCFYQNETSYVPPELDWLKGGDERYNEPFLEQCVRAVGQAIKLMEPVTLHVGRGIDGRVAFNRRFVMRDGTAPCDPEILHAEGPVDPEVGVATFVNRKGRTVAVLLHHTCHPCHGYPHRFVIGDWPGAWVERVRAKFGPGCVPMVINGCCGNIHHCNHIDPVVNHRTDYRDMAAKLMETTERVLGRVERFSDVTPGFARTKLSLPLRRLTPAVVRAAQDLLRKHPTPTWRDKSKTSVEWDWVYATMIIDLKQTQKRTLSQDYEIQAFRIGDLSLVSLMGEPFVEAQLAIKRASPTKYTMVAHFSNGYAGYVPTRLAFEGGGYETNTSNGSKWDPSALERIEQAAVRLLKRACPGTK